MCNVWKLKQHVVSFDIKWMIFEHLQNIFSFFIKKYFIFDYYNLINKIRLIWFELLITEGTSYVFVDFVVY